MKKLSLQWFNTGVVLLALISCLFGGGYYLNTLLEKEALSDAKKIARTILDRDLATHQYLTSTLKPLLFKAFEEAFGAPPPFDPHWMSSTYVIREINHFSKMFTSGDYYAKNAQINARNPKNEADAFERDFLQQVAADPTKNRWEGIRQFNDQPFYVFMEVSEFYSDPCLRCHSTPEAAPAGLVAYYGDQRGFGHQLGEPAGVKSLRIPMANMSRFTGYLTPGMIGVLLIIGSFVILIQAALSHFFVSRPLRRLVRRINGEEPVCATAREALAEIDAIHSSFCHLSEAVERRREILEAEVGKRTAELTAANEELERFTYTVSHDLKAPLITIRTFAELVERDLATSADERTRASLAHICDATQQMTTLLDDLLKLSRAGKMVSPAAGVEMTTVVRDAAAIHRVALERGKVSLRIAEDLGTVTGDKDRLVQVIQNLLDNALKYLGDQPHPVIEIGRASSSGGEAFFVRDNGIGIAAEYHEKVFGLFERLATHGEGSGVGLALVRRIITLHGGKTWIESAGAGQGTTVWFTLPTDKDMRKLDAPGKNP